MVDLKKNKLLIIGIILVLASSFLLAQASSLQAECESFTGKIVQIFDSAKQESCKDVKILQFFGYAGLAISIALLITGFVRRK
jgi:hypothetical protein